MDRPLGRLRRGLEPRGGKGAASVDTQHLFREHAEHTLRSVFLKSQWRHAHAERL